MDHDMHASFHSPPPPLPARLTYPWARDHLGQELVVGGVVIVAGEFLGGEKGEREGRRRGPRRVHMPGSF